MSNTAKHIRALIKGSVDDSDINDKLLKFISADKITMKKPKAQASVDAVIKDPEKIKETL